MTLSTILIRVKNQSVSSVSTLSTPTSYAARRAVSNSPSLVQIVFYLLLLLTSLVDQYRAVRIVKMKKTMCPHRVEIMRTKRCCLDSTLVLNMSICWDSERNI
uniref:Uncharacterized protein n=1 Tax=Cacopsylla melanoneura TaxID=428564 RepID=A0A8D8UWU6_9HEMI